MSDEAERGSRGVGSRLGGWARRVGELVSGPARTSLSDALREPLTEIRTLRLEGRFGEAFERLQVLSAKHADEPFIALSKGLTHVADFVAGGRPFKALNEATEALGKRLESGPGDLLRGASTLFEGRFERALDEFRRAQGRFERLPPLFDTECRFWLHLLTGLAHLKLGNEERAFRELQKARLRFPAQTGAPLRELVVRNGVTLALGAGQLNDAELWIRDLLVVDAEHHEGLELRCRVAAAMGDRVAAHALLDSLGERVSPTTRLWVGLTVGLPGADGRAVANLALEGVQREPESPQARRLWAIAELAGTRERGGPVDPGLADAILRAMADAVTNAPTATRDRHLQELAHASLRLGVLDHETFGVIQHRLTRDEGTAPEELRLLRARHGLQAGLLPTTDFVGPQGEQFRADPDVGGIHGPDPLSPVRSPALRHAVLDSQRALAEAELGLLRGGDAEVAQDRLVEALTHWPDLEDARRRLASLALPPPGGRLEELLTSSTTVLSAIPHRVLGVVLSGIPEAVRQVIAARERLARPLAIAIMGEFSAGKSTFVNALLGEAVAPMGVLPTTTTINVFRRGATGGARVHYRDGRVGLVNAADVQAFLHGLDDAEAQRIRHVEIERTGARMGDAAVVDTPGLNALDGFHERVAREFLDEADAVVWVFSATRGGAASEAEMLHDLRMSGRSVLGVLNKVDTLEGGEQEELSRYLKEQLGNVLAEVVPLDGLRALAWRTDGDGLGDDPFLGVELALDRNFLQKARELKRSLTARRLAEALEIAKAAVRSAAAELDLRADASAHTTGPDFLSTLREFADRVQEGVVAVADPLTREGLGLGLLRTGRGLAEGPIDPLDAEYLEARFRDVAMMAVYRALSEVGRRDPAVGEVLDRHFVPWTRGHLEGLVEAGFVPRLYSAHGARVAQGEAAVEGAFRDALLPMATSWASAARGLARIVEHAHARRQRDATSAPRAQAFRLRSAIETSLDALLKEARGQI